MRTRSIGDFATFGGLDGWRLTGRVVVLLRYQDLATGWGGSAKSTGAVEGRRISCGQSVKTRCKKYELYTLLVLLHQKTHHRPFVVAF